MPVIGEIGLSVLVVTTELLMIFKVKRLMIASDVMSNQRVEWLDRN